MKTALAVKVCQGVVIIVRTVVFCYLHNCLIEENKK
jgi:hypothetical protein